MSGVDLPGLSNFHLGATNRNKKGVRVDLKTPDGRTASSEGDDLSGRGSARVSIEREGTAAYDDLDSLLERIDPSSVH